MKKTVIALLLALVMILALASCTKENTKDPANTTGNSDVTTGAGENVTTGGEEETTAAQGMKVVEDSAAYGEVVTEVTHK